MGLISNKVFRGSVWIVIEKLFRLILGFFLFAFIARQLGAESFGFFSLALSVYGILFAILPLGMQRQAVRELALESGQSQINVYVNYCFLRVVSCLFFSVLCFTVVIIFDFDRSFLWIALAVAFCWAEVVEIYCQGS